MISSTSNNTISSFMVYVYFTWINVFSEAFFSFRNFTFYCRYVDDTLLVVKPQDVSRIHKLLKKIDKNLKFTVDLSENEVPHFLDLEILPGGISNINFWNITRGWECILN